jgi:hypothetical protein
LILVDNSNILKHQEFAGTKSHKTNERGYQLIFDVFTIFGNKREWFGPSEEAFDVGAVYSS